MGSQSVGYNWVTSHSFSFLHFFWAYFHISRNGVVGLCDNYVLNFLRNCYSIFHCSGSSLHSHQQCIGFRCLHILTISLFSVSLIILVGMQWHLTMALIRISLMMGRVVRLLVCLLTLDISSLEKCLFKSFAHFFTGLFVFALLQG